MKWVLKIIGGGIILLLLGLAVILVPAHMQVRNVEPRLPSQSGLSALLSPLGSRGPISVSYLLTSRQELERGQISHISILLEWENGKRFLIDTGMSRSGAAEFAALIKKMDSTAGKVDVVGSIDELLGPEIKDVAGVGFTHLHIDHTQGIESFCNVRGEGAVLFQTATQRELHNFNTSEGADLIANSCLKPIVFSSTRSENMYEADQFPGLAAIELGGHTPGSTLWAVAQGQRILLFSGDITNDKKSIDLDIPKKALYSYLIVPENIRRTQELRKWLKALDQSEQFSVIVSHDLASTKAHLPSYKQN